MKKRLGVAVTIMVCQLCSVAPFIGRLQAKKASRSVPLARIPLEPYLQAEAVVPAVVGGRPGTFMFDTGEGVFKFFAVIC